MIKIVQSSDTMENHLYHSSLIQSQMKDFQFLWREMMMASSNLLLAIEFIGIM